MNNAIRRSLAAFALCFPLSLLAVNYSGEYYWNSDPGVGKANKISGLNVSDDNVIETAIDASAAKEGLNVLGIRVFTGQWSPTITRYVFVPETSQSISHTICEYWWDTDPGVGNSELMVECGTDGNGLIDLDLFAENLTVGFHTLGIRTNINGHWSATHTSLVFVKDNTSDKIDRAEYFWGPDPGCGNGTPLDITSGEVVILDNLELDFPSEIQDDYSLTIRAHSEIGGWGICYVKVFTPVHAVDLRLDYEQYQFIKLNDQLHLTATIDPADSWENTLIWSSSDTNVAQVNSEGLVTSVGEGEAVITVAIEDTELSAQCIISVEDQSKYPLGDSNGNMEVTVTDVATTVSHILGKKPDPFIFTAADVTLDGEITLADAVGTVNIILGINEANVLQSSVRASVRTSAEPCLSMQAKGYTMADGMTLVSVELENTLPVTALQFDMILPEGINPEGINMDQTLTLGNRADGSHMSAYRQIDKHIWRIVVYSSVNAEFYDNTGEVLTFVFQIKDGIDSGMIRFANAKAVESNAIEHSIQDFTMDIAQIAAIDSTFLNNVEVYVEGDVLHIVSPAAAKIPMVNVNGILYLLDVKEGHNMFTVKHTGVYIVNGVKVVVK